MIILKALGSLIAFLLLGIMLTVVVVPVAIAYIWHGSYWLTLEAFFEVEQEKMPEYLRK